MMNKKYYIIMLRSGDLDSYYVRPIGVTENRTVAAKYVKTLIDEHDKINKLAIKNLFIGNKGKIEYRDLVDEFDLYILDKYFPHVDIENIDIGDILFENILNEGEINDFDKYVGNYASEYFKEWCKTEKGLSDEVIEATIKYNSEEDFGTYQYYVETVDGIEENF